MTLDGKVAIVTGGAQGLGKGIVDCLARDGADIAIVDINGEGAQTAAEDVKSKGRKTLAVQADLTKKDQADRAVREVLDFFGRIDILVNNAGGYPTMSSLAERLSEWAAQGGPWAGYWSLLGALAELEAWLGRRDMVQSHLLHQLPALEAGRLPRSARRRLRREAAEVLAAGRSLRRRLRRQLRRGLPRAEVEEFLASRLDGHEALMRGLLDVVG